MSERALCERCGESIDLGCERQVRPPLIHDKGASVPIPKVGGYIDVCNGCLLDTDVFCEGDDA